MPSACTTFIEELMPCIGIWTQKSSRSNTPAETPTFSLPTQIANALSVGKWQSNRDLLLFVISKPISLYPWASNWSKIANLSAAKVKATRFSVDRAVRLTFRCDGATEAPVRYSFSTPIASANRNTEPTFKGSTISSQITTKGKCRFPVVTSSCSNCLSKI